jgi:hypothetical protein
LTIVTRPATQEYRDNWDSTFGSKKVVEVEVDTEVRNNKPTILTNQTCVFVTFANSFTIENLQKRLDANFNNLTEEQVLEATKRSSRLQAFRVTTRIERLDL